MLQKYLGAHTIVLASGSPRRQQFFKDLQIPFEVRLKPVDEIYPSHLKGAEISDYLAVLKAQALITDLAPKEILITSDTVVWHQQKSLAKPENKNEAYAMLKSLSNNQHQVITSVCFTTIDQQQVQRYSTDVRFKKLTDEEIWYYIEQYSPFDKAGSYGIQEWIGHIGITEIKGSYNSVMGLPTHILYKTLMAMVSSQ